MAIKRYAASKDTTITNAFRANLTTRGTGSNMGAADVLETFSIYAQAGTGSVEKARILVQFPTTDISTDRTAGNVPASGSVSFYLRMFNVEHSLTLPKNFTLSVRPATKGWQEGTGLDMDEYRDETYGLYEGANWEVAQSGSTGSGIGAAATLADAIDLTGIAQNDAFTMTVPTAAGGDGVAHQFVFDNGTDVESLSDTTGFGINIAGAADDAAAAAVVVKAINGVADNLYQYGGAALGADSTLAAGTLGLTAAISSGAKITLTMDDKGPAGNVASVLAANTGFEDALLLEATFTGGSDLASWTTGGGDYATDSNYVSYTQTFPSGTESLEVNVTSLVEEWMAGTRQNYGVGVHMSGSHEAEAKSYYTKKFFSRTSEYYFRRPIIEARWDSSKKDERANFFLSSSLVPEADNVNTLYLYNYVRGQLKNIPVAGDTAATATITITDYTELNAGDKVNLVATDGTDYNFTQGDQSSVNGTFEATTSNNQTATNLMNVINTSSGPSGTRFTAAVDGAVVTATQATTGADGNTTVTLTDSGTAGMTKTNFSGALNAVGGTGAIYVSIHSGTTAPGAFSAGENPVELASGGGRVLAGTFATGGYVEPGIYSASVVVTGTLASNYYYYDVWSNGQGGSGQPAATYFTGSGISTKTYAGSNINPSNNYVTNIKNMKRVYTPEEVARLRVSVRDKNWSPNIYTAASTAVSNTIIDDAYYKVYRLVDDLEVVEYGTGSITPEVLDSTGSYTRLSYDVSGNYFDLDMSMFQVGYTYGIKLCYYNTNDYQEQPEIFKFRVEELDER